MFYIFESLLGFTGSFIVIFCSILILAVLIGPRFFNLNVWNSISYGIGLGFIALGAYLANIAGRFFSSNGQQSIPFFGVSNQTNIILENISIEGDFTSNLNNVTSSYYNQTGLTGNATLLFGSTESFSGNITYIQNSFPNYIALIGVAIAIFTIGLAYIFDVNSRINSENSQRRQLEDFTHIVEAFENKLDDQKNLLNDMEEKIDEIEVEKETEYYNKYFKIIKKL